MSELLKKLNPIELVRSLGSEAIWMFNKAQEIKASVGEMTFEDWGEAPDYSKQLAFHQQELQRDLPEDMRVHHQAMVDRLGRAA